MIDATSFCEVYRMRKCLFVRLHNVVCSSDDYFEHKTNCAGAIVCLPCKKQLPCACPRLVHPLRRKKNIVRWYLALLENPCCVGAKGVHMCFEHEYLCQPTHHDIVTQMTVNQDRG